MPDVADRTQIPPKSKPAVVTHNRPKKSAAMLAKLKALGIPLAIARDFPLTPNQATQRWCKKLPTPKGPRVVFFGGLSDWQAALDCYNADKEAIVNGRPRPSRDGTDVEGLRLIDLINKFLHFKRGLVDTGELSMRSWYDYQVTGERIVKVFGAKKIVEHVTPSDFEQLRADYAKTWKAVRCGNEINRVRIIFRYAFETGLILAPVKFGTFKRPSRHTLRKAKAKDRHQHGARMFTAEELRKIIDAAPQPMRSMVLLGINGGLNNQDVATVPISAFDLERGILDFPRGKTGVPRIIPLWAETVESIRQWMTTRPTAKHAEDEPLMFLSKQRRPWYRTGRFVE